MSRVCAAWRAWTRRSREHEEQHEHEQQRGSEHAERGQVAVAAAREAAAAALDAHRLFTERDLHTFSQNVHTTSVKG